MPRSCSPKWKRRARSSLDLGDGSSESLDRDDLQVRLQAKPGWAAAQGKACVVVLSTELSPELITEGLAREIVHAVQSAAKTRAASTPIGSKSAS